MRKLIVLFVYFTVPYFCYSNDLLFKPLKANVFEPKVGAIYEFDDDKLRLDIGNSLDLFKFNNKLFFTNLNFGTEFYVISRLRSEGRMKFPVETADYYFGINSSSKLAFDGIDLFVRLRLGHISSHLIDGYTDNWKFIKEPFVYSREFVDLISALRFDNIRTYLGFTGIFSTIPKDVNKIIPQIGFDGSVELLEKFKFIYGYDFKLNGYEDIIVGINSLRLGFEILTNANLALELSYNYYSGLSMHGMFYKERDNYNSFGFFVIF